MSELFHSTAVRWTILWLFAFVPSLFALRRKRWFVTSRMVFAIAAGGAAYACSIASLVALVLLFSQNGYERFANGNWTFLPISGFIYPGWVFGILAGWVVYRSPAESSAHDQGASRPPSRP